MPEIWHSPCGRMELRLGRWQDGLADVTECDAVITDPPYSERTHAGQRSNDGKKISAIDYAPKPEASTIPCPVKLASRWYVIFSDHAGARENEAELESYGLYVFAPVIWVKTDAIPRLAGDGPKSAAEYITVARPRARVLDSGSRPGHYVGLTAGPETGVKFMGQKPVWLMRKLIRDYSRPGDLIVDPYAGSGTTLLAAAMEGRRCIGAEMDPDTFALSVKRLSKGYTESLFTREAKPAEQQEMNYE